MKFFIFALLLSGNVFAEIIPTGMNDFIGGGSKQIKSDQDVRLPTKAYVKEDQCMMFLKDNESYWKFHETPTLKVESIGEGSIKVRKYLFLGTNKERWVLDSKAISIPFAEQLNYYISSCPPDSSMMSNAELELIKKK